MFYSEQLNHRHVYAHPDELVWLRTFAVQLPDPAEIVMIGAGPGVLLHALLEGLSGKARITVVDIRTCKYTEAYLKDAGYSVEDMTFVVGDSYDVGISWKRPIDFLIVDGDHSYKGVLRDITAWERHVTETVFFHDFLERPDGFMGCGTWIPGEVAGAIMNLSPSFEITEFVGISAVARIRER